MSDEKPQLQVCELSGVEISRELGGPPISATEELKKGDIIYSPWLTGGFVKATVEVEGGRISGTTGAVGLVLGKTDPSDPRGSVWVCRGFMNLRALEKIALSVSEKTPAEALQEALKARGIEAEVLPLQGDGRAFNVNLPGGAVLYVRPDGETPEERAASVEKVIEGAYAAADAVGLKLASPPRPPRSLN